MGPDLMLLVEFNRGPHLEQGFEKWGTLLGGEVMAAAQVDRVRYHRRLMNIRGNSFRGRDHTALRQALSDLDIEVNRRTDR